MMSQLTFSASTEVDTTLDRVFLTLQETSGPGINVRIGFDPGEMRAEPLRWGVSQYLMAVLAALPEVVANYTEDVAREATDRGIL